MWRKSENLDENEKQKPWMVKYSRGRVLEESHQNGSKFTEKSDEEELVKGDLVVDIRWFKTLCDILSVHCTLSFLLIRTQSVLVFMSFLFINQNLFFFFESRNCLTLEVGTIMTKLYI